jgi:hypothetical protein
MFRDSDLESYIKTKNTLEIKSYIVAEWNMNDLDNLDTYGNYRYRLNSSASADANFVTLSSNFDPTDQLDLYSEADLSVNLSTEIENDDGKPQRFRSIDENRKLYFNLRQCFEPFRPRSGINKVLWQNGKYIDNIRSAKRPRYYLASNEDTFKYWNSYRKEPQNNVEIERGISKSLDATTVRGYDIDDVAPFVIYRKQVPANRIVVKIQTNLTDDDSTVFIRNRDGERIQDPLRDLTKSSIPKRWGIQYLNNNNEWINAISFDENSVRSDGTRIVPTDGHVEIAYGIKIPETYRQQFHLVDYINSFNLLPYENNVFGEAYILNGTTTAAGSLYVWDGEDWDRYDVEYDFALYEEDDTKKAGIIKQIVNPKFFTVGGTKTYRDFVFLKGLRVYAETMQAANQTFDLIELSPRLVVDLTDYVSSFSISKDITNDQYGLPVGSLLASNGTLTLMNYDNAFTYNNPIIEYPEYEPPLPVGFEPSLYNDLTKNQRWEKYWSTTQENEIIPVVSRESSIGNSTSDSGSLIAPYLKPNVKFNIYEVVRKIPYQNSASIFYDKYIPIKTFYNEDFPKSYGGKDISVSLRDLFFRFETTKSPSIFLQNISLTGAISILLDNAGFSNYVFDTDSTAKDPIIPYFFIEDNVSVADVLNRLAIASQTAMFFDEYNNFVVKFKEKLLPTSASASFIFDGNDKSTRLSNIQDIESTEMSIINNGVINYTARYIQRESVELENEMFLTEDKVFRYKPVLLWEVSAQDSFATMNESSQNASFPLAAIPLNSDLNNEVPKVENREIINNIIDVGDYAYFLARPKGLLYSGGEIIRYEGIEYAVSSSVATNISTVFITSNEEYQNYVSKLPFAGKIYPTGRIRIYAEPYYEEISINNAIAPQTVLKNGEVKTHGRGQFGTTVAYHSAGLPPYWSNNNHIDSFVMDSEVLFTTKPVGKIEYNNISFSSLQSSASVISPKQIGIGGSQDLRIQAQKTKRTGVIKNHLRNISFIDTEDLISEQTKLPKEGAIQTSALSFIGPNPMPTQFLKRNVLSYVYKDFSKINQDIDNINNFDMANSASTFLLNKIKHVGTRIRIVGVPKTNNTSQSILNSGTYYNVTTKNDNEQTNIDGGSGGVAICFDPVNNYGYFFEICSLTQNNLEKYSKYDAKGNETESVHNLIFYKIVPGINTTNGNSIAVPVKLWGSLSNILVNEGLFTDNDRVFNEENPTVYDIAIEYTENEDGSKTFLLYFNDDLIATVKDKAQNGIPILPSTNTSALFVRGSSNCIFEYFYGMSSKKENDIPLIEQIPKAFGIEQANSKAMRKYSISGLVQNSYLSSISSRTVPKINMYFEEFGSIMREAYYFDIKYDQAYPAMLSFIAPTLNNERGYVISGYYGGGYGAEFLIFNTANSTIVLDDATANFLRILGVTFTQNTTRELTVDDFLNKISDFSDPTDIRNTNIITSQLTAQKILETAKNSRFKYGNRDFSIESPYIQTFDFAENLMEWLITKTMRERKMIGLNTFGSFILQLGDIVSVNYKMPKQNLEDHDQYFVDTNKKFVISGINYSKSNQDIVSNFRLVEI